MTDHYQTLGVAKNATPDEIKKAYRRLAAIHHPDKGGDTAMFQKVQAAYETLSDPQKKQEYDNPNPFGAGGNPFGAQGGFPGGFHFNMNGFDMNDLFGGMFGQQRPRGFATYRTTVAVSLEQAYSGSEQTLNINGPTGPQVVTITIPKGVDNGQTLRFENIIPNGILLVEFRVLPHASYERDGPNLYSEVKIDVLDLIIGTTIKFRTLSGKDLDVNVPANSQPNSKLRISGEGMPYHMGIGDQYLLLKAYIPNIIDSRIIDAIKQYK